MKFKTKPRSHQLRIFNQTKDKKIFALFWEQGTGKTKAMIDLAAYLSMEGHIDGVLVHAPNFVHRAWVKEQIPEHMVDEVPYNAHIWNGMGTKKEQHMFKYCMDSEKLFFFTMNYEATITKAGVLALDKFFKKRKVLHILDESHRIKTYNSQTTKAIIRQSHRTEWRRELSGTPIGKLPFDLYSQMEFLSPEIFGFPNYFVFTNYFGKYIKVELDVDTTTELLKEQLDKATDHKKIKELIAAIKTSKDDWTRLVRLKQKRKPFRKLVSFMNQNELQEKIKPVSDRVLKSEVSDIPPKTFQTRYFKLNSKCQKYYDQLKQDFIVELDAGEVLTVQMAMTRIGKLQQIACGFLYDKDGSLLYEDTQHTRPKVLMDMISDFHDKQFIVWAKYDYDVNIICRLLKEAGYTVAQYDGQVKKKEKLKNYDAFKAGGMQVFVSKVSSGGTGLNLQHTSDAFYYSNDWRYIDRTQSEDRQHRDGQENKCLYIDVMAEGTVDERIRNRLKETFDISNNILDGGLREWFT